MKNDEMIILRANILGGMDVYIRDVIGDDDYTDYWNSYGVPDEADEAEIMEIAENTSEWARICAEFGIIIRRYGLYEHLMAEDEVSG